MHTLHKNLVHCCLLQSGNNCVNDNGEDGDGNGDGGNLVVVHMVEIDQGVLLMVEADQVVMVGMVGTHQAVMVVMVETHQAVMVVMVETHQTMMVVMVGTHQVVMVVMVVKWI